MKNIQKWTLVILMFPLVSPAGQLDSIVICLKTGGRLHVELISINKNTVSIKHGSLGQQDLSWNDIHYISSKEVYDSLNNHNSFIVLPLSAQTKPPLFKTWSGEIMVSNSSAYDRNVGLGARGNVEIANYFTVGGIVLTYWGTSDTYASENLSRYLDLSKTLPAPYYGYGMFTYIAPEIGSKYSFSGVEFGSYFSYGLATIRTNRPLNGNSDATEGRSCLIPGFGAKFTLGNMKIGLQYRYIFIESLNMSAVHFTVGN
jgi:hypothetical protein